MSILFIALALIAFWFAFGHWAMFVQVKRMEHEHHMVARDEARYHAWCTAAMLLAAFVALGLIPTASAQADSTLAQPASPAAAAAVRVPDRAFLYRRMVEQAATEVWGVQASVARLAAQIHQESGYRATARSEVGAQGFAQFMPATAHWMAEQFPRRLGEFDPWDPQQAVLAAALYDQWLLARVDGASACADWAFALSAYNGGLTALHAEAAHAARAGANARRWFGAVARYRARSAAAWTQNRGYVRRILTVLEPAYIDAGWPGHAVCP